MRGEASTEDATECSLLQFGAEYLFPWKGFDDGIDGVKKEGRGGQSYSVHEKTTLR